VPGFDVAAMAVELLEMHNIRNPHRFLKQPLRGPERENAVLMDPEETTMPVAQPTDNQYYHLVVHQVIWENGTVRRQAQQFGQQIIQRYFKHVNDHKQMQGKADLAAAVGPVPQPAPNAVPPIQFGQKPGMPGMPQGPRRPMPGGRPMPQGVPVGGR
jgi:hypothetical protein